MRTTQPRTTEYVTCGLPGLAFVHSAGCTVNIVPHTHIATYVILLVRFGVVYITTPAGAFSLRAGKHYAIPPHCLHGVRASARHSLLSLCIDNRLIGGGTRQVSEFLEIMVHNSRLRQTEKNRFFKAFVDATPQAEESEDSLRSLKEGMIATPDRDFTLSGMAEYTHLEKCHLIRLFKKRYGLSPCGFLVQNRLRKARKLLSGNITLTATALQAGFYDQSHFIRHFKRLHGLTPRQYLISQVSISNASST